MLTLSACGISKEGQVSQNIDDTLDKSTRREIEEAISGAQSLVNLRLGAYKSSGMSDPDYVQRELMNINLELGKVPDQSYLAFAIGSFTAIESLYNKEDETALTYVYYWASEMPNLTKKILQVSQMFANNKDIPVPMDPTEAAKRARLLSLLVEDSATTKAIDAMTKEMNDLMNSERAVRLMKEMKIQ
jgi:hypothetical protein